MQSQQQQEGTQVQIKNYLLGKTVGEGTFGKVKSAVHVPTGEKVAVKIIVKSKIADVNDVERVARELHILKIVRHPISNQIIETPKHLFIVTEFAEQGELYEHIVKNGHLSEEQAFYFFHQLISGLKYLKELRISHRDLKPENLLLDENLNLKIIDFGLSNTYQPQQTLKTACGSPCYAAPEMLGGKSYDGTSVDIWSCGIILFAMVCGYLPFQDPNTNKLYKKILQGKIPFPSTVTPEFVDLVSRILEVEPLKRATLEEIEKHNWFQISDVILPDKGLKIGTHLIKADPKILKEIEKIGFDSTHAKVALEANKQGADYSAYYLQMKKMKREGYLSEYDINSPLFEYWPPFNDQQSFENTRKSYYFGVRDLSPLKKSKKKRQKSMKKTKPSPSRSDLQLPRKKNIKISQKNFANTLNKISKTAEKKWGKALIQATNGRKTRNNIRTKSFNIYDSPIRSTFYNTGDQKNRVFSSGSKGRHISQQKKNKNSSFMFRYT